LVVNYLVVAAGGGGGARGGGGSGGLRSTVTNTGGERQVTILYLVRLLQLVAVTAQVIVIICRLQEMVARVAGWLLLQAQRQQQAQARHNRVSLVAQLAQLSLVVVAAVQAQSVVTE
jgi:hypothetical protein